MEGMGWNRSIVITPGSGNADLNAANNKNGIQRAKQSTPNLNYEDFVALRSTLKYQSMYGMIESSSIFRIGNKTRNVRLRATNAEFFRNKTYTLQQGRYFNEYENDNAMAVAVLGYNFAKEHFKDKKTVGEYLQLGDHRLKIVGVLGKDALDSGHGMNFNTFERREDVCASALWCSLSRNRWYGASDIYTSRF